MEMENRYASKGVGGTALGLAIGALGVEALRGGFNGILGGGGGGCCNEDHLVNRYELGMQQELAAKDTKISLLESNIYVDTKIADVYERLNGKISCVEAQLNSQAVINAQVTANLSCLQNTVNVLSGMTKTVIPISNICPAPMEKYNSWVAPTTTATT